MAYKVEITARAARDVDSLLSWLRAQQAGEAGQRWFDGLEQAIATLADMPERCALAPENARVPFEVRHLLYANAARRGDLKGRPCVVYRSGQLL